VLPSIVVHFRDLPDPRLDHPNKLHKLLDIVVIVIWATLANQETWVDIAEYAREKEPLLRQHLELPNGIPSHDTLNRAFALIQPELFETLFYSWMEQQTLQTQDLIRRLMLDGKLLRGTRSSGTGKVEQAQEALNIVTLYSSSERLVLKQGVVKAGSNEIPAVRNVLEGLNLENAVVSMDALHAQTLTLTQIKDQKGDYVVGVKKNQRKLHAGLKDLFEDVKDKSKLEVFKTFDVKHGRQEERCCYVVRDLEQLKEADCRIEAFTGLKSVLMMQNQVIRGGKTSFEQRFYLSSLEASAEDLHGFVRGHWAIENEQHYVLDVTFHEDANRTRSGFAAQNLALVRRMVFNILSLDGDRTKSMRGKRVKASFSDEYVRKLLGLVS
jgi:predicted transposase YbfD/YdcC